MHGKKCESEVPTNAIFCHHEEMFRSNAVRMKDVSLLLFSSQMLDLKHRGVSRDILYKKQKNLGGSIRFQCKFGATACVIKVLLLSVVPCR